MFQTYFEDRGNSMLILPLTKAAERWNLRWQINYSKNIIKHINFKVLQPKIAYVFFLLGLKLEE